MVTKPGAPLFILSKPVHYALDSWPVEDVWAVQTFPAVVSGMSHGRSRTLAVGLRWAVEFLDGSYVA